MITKHTFDLSDDECSLLVQVLGVMKYHAPPELSDAIAALQQRFNVRQMDEGRRLNLSQKQRESWRKRKREASAKTAAK